MRVWNRTALRVWLLAVLMICCSALHAEEAAQNMIGRQSHNVGIPVVPAPGAVKVDGELEDWDWSGRVWVFADKAVRNRYSVEAAAMWDRDHLYLAAKWRDPTPMYSTVDPRFNPNDGWKSDSWQLRVQTDRTSWLTTWFFAPRKMPVLHVDHWRTKTNSRGEHDVRVLTAEPGGTKLGEGAEMAYRETRGGQGFVQEIKLPWKIIYAEVPEVKADMRFRLGMEFLWGDPTGKTWPVHRYADVMAPEHTSREFFWSAWKAWGWATLQEKGNVPVRQYIGEAVRLPGTIPVRAEVPRDAARFTIAVNDAKGNRVRNLAGDFMPDEYAVADAKPTAPDRRVVEVLWDGLNDDGKLVAPGTYDIIGLTHGGLGAEYELCFYNPGKPPWLTRSGSGGWGADHSDPVQVARAGDWMIVSWPFAEGGHGIIGIDPTGQKRWGERRGAPLLCADDNYVYGISSSWHKSGTLCRFAKKDGSYQPFVLAGEKRPFELEFKEIFRKTQVGKPRGLAAADGLIVLALSAVAEDDDAQGKLAFLEAESARLLRLVDAPDPTAVALGPKGLCYAVCGGRLHRVLIEGEALRPVPTPGVGLIAAIAIDNDGNVVIADTGPDSQVKAYSPEGRLVYTCGRKGGRPIRGKFDEQAMVRMSSVAVDGKDRVWVVESWPYPRRVSVWGRNGMLVRDYIGNTGYAGTGSYLHDQDPTLGYVGPIEMKLNREDRTWKVTQILWVPDPSRGESFPVNPRTHALPQRFRSDASGTMREYLYTHPYDRQEGHVVFMERENGWQPVAAVCLVGHVSGRITHHGKVSEKPSGQFADLNAYDGCFWNDMNRDGVPQRTECHIVKTKHPATGKPRERPQGGIPLGSGWGGRIGRDFVFYADGLVRYRPLRFTDDGAPVYGPESMERFGPEERGDLVPVPQEDLLLCLSWKGYAGPTTGMLGISGKTGEILWSYPNPYPGVHGSHRAIMPKPGLLIGPLKIVGVADIQEPVGRVFALRGNLGQDFFMTTDGLFVGAMFEDGRLPGESLPAKESMLVGVPMETYSHGGEPFNGWFGKHSDGTVRMSTGFARQACMVLEVKGLETIRRFKADAVHVTPRMIAQAREENALRMAAAAKPKEYAVPRIPDVPKIDGDLKEWKKLPAARISRVRSPFGGSARLAYDDKNLYVAFEVRDPSPWRNEGKDFTRLFKTGDAVDVQLNVDPAMSGRDARRKLAASDVRVIFSQLGGKPVAVLMKPIDPDADPNRRVKYHSPVTDRVFDRVEVLEAAKVAVQVRGHKYWVEAAVPLEALGLQAKPGLMLRGDLGIVSSDEQGITNVALTYWSNPNTNLVSDLPHEAWLYPYAWGKLEFK